MRIANKTHKRRAEIKSQKAPADRGWPFQLDARLIVQHRVFWDILMIVFVGYQPQHGGGATQAQRTEENKKAIKTSRKNNAGFLEKEKSELTTKERG